MRILVVDDERKLARVLRMGLSEHGHAVDEAHTGEKALALARAAAYDLVILDIWLPGLDGFQVCRVLRSEGQTMPVLMLTARDTVADRVAGLDCGADDYLVKPFAFPELLARVRALLRRSGPSKDRMLRAADVELDTVTHQVRRAGRLIDLTSREQAILEYFLRNPDRPLSRDQIAQHVWGSGFMATSNVIDVYIATLRRKLGDQDDPRLFHTLRGIGYQLMAAVVT